MRPGRRTALSAGARLATPKAMTPMSGKDGLELDGLSYMPRFMSVDEAEELASAFAQLHPIWERRHALDDRPRQGAGQRRLTRPVYWLGGWQFASLGYYAHPDHLVDRCVRSDPFPEILQTLLQRMEPHLTQHHQVASLPPYSSALVNFYGSEVDGARVKDMSRLRAHHDSEPGPVVMLSVGQPALFEFVERPDDAEAVLSLWARHRSAVVISGRRFKDVLYHRVTRVRHGKEPELHCKLDDFRVRRISVSVRHVPQEHIKSVAALSAEARKVVLPYVRQLAETSTVFRNQLAEVPADELTGSG